jgi:hypothetical protein
MGAGREPALGRYSASPGAGRRLGRGRLGRAFGLGPGGKKSYVLFFLKYFPVQRLIQKNLDKSIKPHKIF